MGKLKQDFISCEFVDGMLENKNETHFFFNMGNHRTFGLKRSKKFMYDEPTAEEDGFIVVLLTYRGTEAKIQAPFLIFGNRDQAHPMKTLTDDMNGVSYRTVQCAWTDRTGIYEGLNLFRLITLDSENY